MEKMLVTQALDERDLLVKKINDKIVKLEPLDVIRNNAETGVESRMTREDFKATTESAYQQIIDLIDRFDRLDAAIVNSNANTTVIVGCKEMSVAGAIALRNRMTAVGSSKDFERSLINVLRRKLSDASATIKSENNNVTITANSMRMSILGNDAKTKDDKPLAVVDAYVSENSMVMMDPLGVAGKIDDMTAGRDAILRELDTAIKVSNATTTIEF